jgi:hypothetical protein
MLVFEEIPDLIGRLVRLIYGLLLELTKTPTFQMSTFLSHFIRSNTLGARYK